MSFVFECTWVCMSECKEVEQKKENTCVKTHVRHDIIFHWKTVLVFPLHRFCYNTKVITIFGHFVHFWEQISEIRQNCFICRICNCELWIFDKHIVIVFLFTYICTRDLTFSAKVSHLLDQERIHFTCINFWHF
jgi:hypothetical protein